MALLAPISHGFLEDDGGAPGLYVTEAGVVVLRSAQGGPLVPIGGGGGGANAFSWTSKTLSSADLLALDTTPVEILPAPGGRKYYVVEKVVYHYRFHTTPYSGGNSSHLFVGYGSTVGELTGPGIGYGPGGNATSFPQSDMLQQTEDAYAMFGGDSQGSYNWWRAVDIENRALAIVLASSPFIDGDGTLTVRLYHATIDGAP